MPLRNLFRRPNPNDGIGHWIHTFTLHVLTGFLAVAAHYAVMYALVRTGARAVPASSVGFLFGALTKFALSYWQIFTPTRGVTSASIRFAVAIAAQLVANSALLTALLAQGLSLWPAQVITTVVLTFANYLAYRLWVFR